MASAETSAMAALEMQVMGNALGARDMFSASYSVQRPPLPLALATKVAIKVRHEYDEVRNLPATAAAAAAAKPPAPKFSDSVAAAAPTSTLDLAASRRKVAEAAEVEDDEEAARASSSHERTMIKDPNATALDIALATLPTTSSSSSSASTTPSSALVAYSGPLSSSSSSSSSTGVSTQLVARGPSTDAIMKMRREREQRLEAEWHAPWRLSRVIAGHQGWVRTLAVDPSNEWFATGSTDRTIKIWDLASGSLRLTLPGHVSSVRAIAISDRHPYLFSASEDKEVKCWDLEQNKVVRDYHGHFSGVYSLRLHPTLDLVVTGSRDGAVKVWDMRTRVCVRNLVGHRHAVGAIDCQGTDPQVITGSMDCTVRLWDIIKGRAITTLTHHKKSVRALRIHPLENSFVSASADNLKMWKLSEGIFMRNAANANAIVNTVAINHKNVLVAGADNGHLAFYDWRTGLRFQDLLLPPQPGSMDNEAGIFCAEFDRTGTRLLTAEADKTIKVFREVEDATPETYPAAVALSKRTRVGA